MRPETAGAVGAAAGVVTALTGLAAWRAYTTRADHRRPPLVGPGLTPAAGVASADAPSAALSSAALAADPIVREQLIRNIQFFGPGGQAAVCDALVVVVGLGVS